MLTKAQKSEYNRQWYRANRSYKKTYSRMQRRTTPESTNEYDIVTLCLIEDRQRQVKAGRWIDERTDLPYTGIVSPATYM